jgi:2,3-bisphosphoglycerate-dependent phosphoglycerate mutase
VIQESHIQLTDRPSRAIAFHFIRHGATAHNLKGIRCGGDLDIDLCEFGRRQAKDAALKIRAIEPRINLIVTSGLRRATETACILSNELNGIPIVVEPLFAERHLGGWNERPIAETEEMLRNNITPPGGEAEEVFLRRIGQALNAVTQYFSQHMLIVGSSGVGRAVHTLLGGVGHLRLANGEIARFTVALDLHAFIPVK